MIGADRQARLFRIIAAAASPQERAGCRGFRAIDTPPETRESRRSAWAAAVANEPGRFAAVLKARGIDDELQRAMLADVEVADESTLPRWAGTLAELLQRIVDVDSPPMAAAETVLYEAFTPWLVMGRSDSMDVAGRHRFALSGRAVEGTLNSLTRRIFNAAGLPLQQQLRLSEIAEGTPFSPNRQRGLVAFAARFSTAAGWLEFFESLPVTARLVAVAYDHWRATLDEMFERLERDFDVIAAEVTGRAAPRVLDNFTGDAGDIHAHGRSVMLLTFDGGERVVYKPKDLRIVPWFHDLAEPLGRSAGLLLRRRRILLRGSYAWEEFVEKAPCSAPAEVERFYARLGALLALLQALDGRDFWLDNVIASSDHPELIDLETLAQPRILNSSASPLDAAIDEVIAESPLLVGILPLWNVLAPRVCAVDLGALSDRDTLMTPLRVIASSGNESYLTVEASQHLPSLQGARVRSSGYLPQFGEGFDCMHAAMAGYDAAAAIDALAGLPVRFIVRNTWLYYQIIQASTSPMHLADGWNRELFLERLWRSTVPDPIHFPGVLASEIDSLRDLDVPFFRSTPGSQAILTAEGQAIPDFFDGLAQKRIAARFGVRAEHPRSGRDHELIDASLQTLEALRRDSGTVIPSRNIAHGATPEPRTATSLEARCRNGVLEIVEALRRSAIVRSGEAGWIAIARHPWSDMERVEAAPADLLSGTCGVALFLAEAARETRSDDIRAFAQSVMTPIRRNAEGALRRLTGAAAEPGAWFAGGIYYGAASQVYTIRAAASILEEGEGSWPDVDVDALADAANRANPRDLITGAAGLVALLAPKLLGAIGLTRVGESMPPGSSLPEGVPDDDLVYRFFAGLDMPEADDVASNLLVHVASGRTDEALRNSVARALALPARNVAQFVSACELASAAAVAIDRSLRRAAEDAVEALLDARRTRGKWLYGTRAPDCAHLSIFDGISGIGLSLLRCCSERNIALPRCMVYQRFGIDFDVMK